MLLAAATIVCFVTSVCSVARAAEQAPAVALEYSTVEGCPDRDTFLRRLSGRVDFELDDTAPRRLRISFRREASTFRGTLEVMESDKTPMTRELQGVDCEVVADGVGVFVALALRPNEEEATSEAEPQPKVSKRPAARKRPPIRQVIVRPERYFGSFFGLSSRTGGLSLSGVVGGAIEAPFDRVITRATIFGGMSEPASVSGTRLELGVVRLRLEACPAFAGIHAGSFELLPCLGAAGGIRWARAIGLRTEVRPSFEFGGGAHGRYWFDARRTIGLDLSFALDAATTTYAYSRRRADRVALETRVLVGDLGLGLLIPW